MITIYHNGHCSKCGGALEIMQAEGIPHNYTEHLAGKDFSESEWLEILTTHPELMQRPIIVNGDRAVIARPPERLREVL